MKNTIRVVSRITLMLASLLGPVVGRAQNSAVTFAEAKTAFDQGQSGDTRMSERAAELFRRLSEQEPNNPLYLAYGGSSWMLRGRDVSEPAAKREFVERGLSLVDRAVAQLASVDDQATVRGVPVSVETRLVAATAFLALPDRLHRFETSKTLVTAAVESEAYTHSPTSLRAKLQYQASLIAWKEGRIGDEQRALRDLLSLQPAGPLANDAETRLTSGNEGGNQ